VDGPDAGVLIFEYVGTSGSRLEWTLPRRAYEQEQAPHLVSGAAPGSQESHSQSPRWAGRAAAFEADVICLQEIAPSTLPRWRKLMRNAGYLGVEHSSLGSERSRPLAVLTAVAHGGPVRSLSAHCLPYMCSQLPANEQSVTG
jgi:hypothetical protein